MRSFALANSGTRRPLAVGTLTIVATLALIAVAAPQLPQLGERARIVAEDDPYVVLDREITAEFGLQNPVVWAIEAHEGTVWTPALLARIQALTRDVLTIPGIVALDVVSLASPNMRDLRVTEDALEPVYLMAEVPQTAEAIAALRRRVDTDPNLGGTLVSRDGRAAMVVGNFVPDADAQAIASRAQALQARYSDGQARVYVAGAPVLGARAPRAARPLAIGALLVLAAGVLALAWLGGVREALVVVLATSLAAPWSMAVVVALGAAVLPWTGFAIVPTVLMAAAVAASGDGSWRSHLDLGVAMAMAFIAFGVVAGAPAAALGMAGAAGVGAAVLAGHAARTLLGGEGGLVHCPRAVRFGALALVVLAALGSTRLRTSLGTFGYGERYLPESAAADLRGLARHFPPPTALALRFRGAPGFVAAPETLAAFDGLTRVARADPAVVRALSLADIVKMVHRAFNDNRDEFYAIPNDQALIGRYLALAYSPGFRTFVDRGFTRAALWVYLSSEQPGDLARVLSRLEAQLVAQPVPSAQVDLVGGDGAVILATARAARRLAIGTAVFLLLAALGIGVLCGPRKGIAALTDGVVATACASGVWGWLGVPIDLLSLPLLLAAAAVGTAGGALGGLTILVPALGVMALVALAGLLAGANQLAVIAAVVLGAPALARVLTVGVTRRGDAPE
jgi:predicted RND superfamily exporter protein